MVGRGGHIEYELLASCVGGASRRKMNNGTVHPSAQGHGGGTQRELSPWGGGGGSDTRVAKKLLIISFNQIITK